MKNKILLIDDEVINLELISTILKPAYIVYTSDNAHYGFLSACKNKPDLILLDVLMPDMDGFALCKKMKASSLVKKIPIIFLTSKTQDKDEACGFTLGAVDYITKPFREMVDMQRIALHIKLSQNKLTKTSQSPLFGKQNDGFFGFENEIISHYNFTEAETRLSQGLVNGHTLEEISIESGIAYSTLRGYLQNIFAKTKTKKQHELVSSIMTTLLLMNGC